MSDRTLESAPEPDSRRGPHTAPDDGPVVASFRFYEELNDFLSPQRRGHAFEARCARAATVKHMVEALGVPHTEVELVLARSTSQHEAEEELAREVLADVNMLVSSDGRRNVAAANQSSARSYIALLANELEKEKAGVRQWIDRAAVLGAPHIRVFAGSAKGIDEAAARKQVIRSLEELGAYAAAKGVWLGVENHGGVVATPDGLLEIVRAVQSPAVGINLDTGNFHGTDPYADLERCVPWAVNVQVKVEMRPAGAKAAEPADLTRLCGMLKSAGYQGWVTLEYEAKPDPFVAVPEHLKALRAAMA